MTNTETGIQGINIRPTKHNHSALRDWIRQNLAGVSYVQQMFILNRMERAAQFWFEAGAAIGEPEQFEELFNGK